MRLRSMLITGLAAGLTSCATISEEDCQIGAWDEIGYQDGLKGRSSERIGSYAKRCSKYGIMPDRVNYLAGYDQGIARYCTYERGYARGERGERYNQACSGPLAAEFAPGYDAGRAVYEIYQEHEGLIGRYNNTVDALIEVRRKLREDEIDSDERRRLEKKEARLEDKREDLRIDIRAFERLHGLRRHRFD